MAGGDPVLRPVSCFTHAAKCNGWRCAEPCRRTAKIEDHRMTLGDALRLNRGDTPWGAVIAAEVQRFRDEGAPAKHKGQLRAFTPAAAFAHFHDLEHTARYTGAVVFDFDSTPDPAAFRDAAADVRAPGAGKPHALGSFISPSADGVKVIAAVTPVPRSIAEYRRAWDVAADLYEVWMEWPLDRSTDQGNPDRLCFFSYDPEAIIRGHGETWGIRWK